MYVCMYICIYLCTCKCSTVLTIILLYIVIILVVVLAIAIVIMRRKIKKQGTFDPNMETSRYIFTYYSMHTCICSNNNNM